MNTHSTSVQILAAARKVLEAEGTEGVSMRRIAELVDITPMAIYRHYPNRVTLLNAIANQGFDELAKELASRQFKGDWEKQFLDKIGVYLEHSLANPQLFELMFLAKREGARVFPEDFAARRSPTATLIADALEEGMKSGALKQADVWELAFQIGAMAQGLILLKLGCRVSLGPTAFRRLYRQSFVRFLHGLSP